MDREPSLESEAVHLEEIGLNHHRGVHRKPMKEAGGVAMRVRRGDPGRKMVISERINEAAKIPETDNKDQVPQTTQWLKLARVLHAKDVAVNSDSETTFSVKLSEKENSAR